MNIKILGTGCKACKKLHEEVLNVLQELNLDYKVEYISDLQTVMKYNIIAIPALVINEKIISVGKSLSNKEIKKALEGFEVTGTNIDCTDGSCKL